MKRQRQPRVSSSFDFGPTWLFSHHAWATKLAEDIRTAGAIDPQREWSYGQQLRIKNGFTPLNDLERVAYVALMTEEE